jgi:hypothetical protein
MIIRIPKLARKRCVDDVGSHDNEGLSTSKLRAFIGAIAPGVST